MEKEEIIRKYDLDEVIGGKVLIGFESFEDAEKAKSELGGYLTYCKKKAGQSWTCNNNQAWEPFRLNAEDLGFVQEHDKKTVLACTCFNDEIWQCLELCNNELDDAENIDEIEPIKIKILTVKKVARLFSEMKDDEVLLLGEDWMSCENYKIMPAAELTTMSYEYDSTSHAIGLMMP